MADTTATTSSVTRSAPTTIRCGSPSSPSKLPSPFFLGPLDQLVYPIVPVALVYVYRARQDGRETIPLGHLQRAIATFLDFHPHLSGRLAIDERSGVRSIGRLDSGMELYEARCAERLPAGPGQGRITLADLPQGGNALLAPYEPSMDAVLRGPILTIQHTRFACGGVALGVRSLHAVTDAEGFFQLVLDLAEVYRTGTLAQPPHLTPYLSELMRGMSHEEREEALRFDPPLHHAKKEEVTPAYAAKPPADAPPPLPVVGRVLRFSREDLAALKAHATDPGTASGSLVSTFDALSAHIWQRTYRARLRLLGQDPSDASPAAASAADELLSRSYLTSVNYRPRLALPPRSPFNCLMTPYAPLPHETLASGPLSAVAAKVHELTRAVSPEQAQGTARWIAAQRDVRTVAWGFDARRGATMVSAWNKFVMYGKATAFDEAEAEAEGGEQGSGGQGPALVAPPFTPISLVDGLGYPMPTEGQAVGDSAAIDLYLALSEPVWGELERDAEWTRWGSGHGGTTFR